MKKVYSKVCAIVLLAASAMQLHAVDTNEVWVSANATGTGTGTFDDPFSANTRLKFDAVMAGLCANTNMTIHLFPGTYYTAGYYGGSPSGLWTIKSDTKIVGAGMHRTIIARDSGLTVNYDHKMLLEVSDLTIDCAAPTNSTVSFMALIFSGNNSKASRVVAKHAYGTTDSPQYAESFAFAVGASDPIGVVFEDCIATNLLGDYISGFLLNGDAAFISP